MVFYIDDISASLLFPGLENCITDTLSCFPWTKKDDDGQFRGVETGQCCATNVVFVMSKDVKMESAKDKEISLAKILVETVYFYKKIY